jgi:hypothetical protein
MAKLKTKKPWPQTPKQPNFLCNQQKKKAKPNKKHENNSCLSPSDFYFYFSFLWQNCNLCAKKKRQNF